MTRTDYMKSLERLLAALPETERRDALNYYEEYFDDAGADNEAATIAELGTPEEVAQKILENQEFVPAEVSPAPETSALPRAKRRIHWEPIAGCACLVAALAAFVWIRLPVKTATETIVVEGDSIATFGTISSTVDNLTVYDVNLNSLKKLELDLDMGSVTFASEKNLKSARIEIRNPDPHFSIDDSFDPSGSYFKYKAPRSLNLSNASSLSLTIYLPEGFEMDKLDVSLDMGNLDLGDLRVKKLTAELDMGNCKADTLTADTAEIDLDLGDFEASTLSVRDLEASSDMGNIQIGLLYDAKKADLEVDAGNIGLTVYGSPADYAVDAKTDLGKLTVNGQTYSQKFSSRGSRELSLSSSMGSVTLNFQG